MVLVIRLCLLSWIVVWGHLVTAQVSDSLDYDTLTNTYYLKGTKTPANGRFVLEATYGYGGMVLKGKMKDGKKVGIWRCHYDGILSFSKCLYVNGYKEGLEKRYYSYRRRLCSIENYVNGKRDGYSISYDRNGKIESEGSFKQGFYDGYWKTDAFYGFSEGYYVNGRKDGFWKEGNHGWYAEGYYSSGTKFGLWREYDGAGGITMEEKCLSGNIKDGLYKKYYHDDGTLEAEGQYVNDVKTGHWMEHSPNRKFIWEGNYSHNHRNGWWKFYSNTNHELRSEGKLVNDRKEGLWFYYCPDGTLYEVITYRHGVEVE